MDTLGVEEARRRLPELLTNAEAGRQTIIKRRNKAVAALVPIHQRPAAQRRSLLSLRGTGLQAWPTITSPAPVGLSPGQSARFEPHRLTHGSVIAIDAPSLIAFLCDRPGCNWLLEPILSGINQGYWHGLISSLSLGQVLAGPLSRGQEQLAQYYKQVLSDPLHWTVLPVDAERAEAAVRLQSMDLATAIAGGAAVLVSDDPHLAHTELLPVVPTRTRP